MLYYPSTQEALAWFEADDERWAERVPAIAAAAERRERDDSDDT
jgi:hypothetical protein